MDGAPNTDPLGRAVRRTPQALALIHPEGALSYRVLDRYVTGTAMAIMARTAQRRVAVTLDVTWRAIVLLLALIRAGRVVCLISGRWPHCAKVRAAAHVGAVALEEGVDALVCQAREGDRIPAAHASDRPGTLVFTTGSTGEPKAALLSLENHLYSARGANAMVPLRTDDRWLLALPLYHVAGLGVVFRCLQAGACIVVPRSKEPLALTLHRHACTHVSLVTTQLLRLVENRAPLPALRAVIVGGSAAPAALLRQARALGYPVCTTYGLTEMASQVTTLSPEAPSDLLSTAGQVLPHRSLRIDGSGEILVKGPVLFRGYATPSGLHRPTDADGWFATGDLGFMDADGYLHVVGRKDNMFVSGGENIVPEEIERVLCAIEGVTRAIVVAVPDPEFGHRPVAFVAGRCDYRALARVLEETLPRFRVPALRPWPAELPRQGIKADRKALGALAQRA